MTLETLNRLPAPAAHAELLRCCGSKRWATLMVERRPFGSREGLHALAERIWWSLDVADWLEAFAAHPRIGESPTSAWSAEEQSVAKGSATAAVVTRLAELNRVYEQRFGYTFLVCASGRSATDLLGTLERRLGHSPADELQIAAAEQRKITALRLEKLLHP
jgi:2-oxo-4-hydroxy-4-carboxy-5-ureidoimidazoline decarboxylase